MKFPVVIFNASRGVSGNGLETGLIHFLSRSSIACIPSHLLHNNLRTLYIDIK